MGEVTIRVTGGDEVARYNTLSTWLNGNREFRGRVTRVSRPISDGQLGGAIDVITVALGSGGAGMVLAQSLAAWLRNQRADITITVTHGQQKVAVNAQRVQDPQSLLQDVLRAADEH